MFNYNEFNVRIILYITSTVEYSFKKKDLIVE